MLRFRSPVRGKAVKRLPPWIRANPVLPWVFLFLTLALTVTQFGGMNAMSRTAALRAITENHSLHIDNYKEWTIDWAKAPSGHYYSNKAPGVVFLQLPFFALTELASVPLGQKKIDERGRLPQPGYGAHLFLMLTTQLLPFALLVLWIAHWLLARSYPSGAVHFFALATLLGNTAALYMNSNFGHGISALLFLATFFCWLERRYYWVGVFLSWSLLCDYGVAFALPFALFATLWRERNLRSLWRIALGASPGALVWIWFHWSAFGSPFATANQFTNPEQISTLDHHGPHLWGEYSPIPAGDVIWKLLFGPSRGILFTQPWMLAIFALPFMRKPLLPRGGIFFAVGSLAGLLWMNGGFGGWHGGWCLGPRYLSVVFPAMALAITLAWEFFPGWARSILWVGLLVSLVFRILVYPFPNLAPDEDIWAYHFRLMLADDHRGTVILRFAVALAFTGIAVYWWKRRKPVPISSDPV